MRGLSLLLLAAMPVLPAAARPYAIVLHTEQCRTLPPAIAAAFGPDWVGLSRFAERCSVRGPTGRIALTVDVVRLDRAYAVDFFATHPDQPVPRAIIRDANGTPVGFLADQFPVEGPSRKQVTFIRWRNGWPQEIRLYEAGESALAPHPEPPMRWDADSRTYIETN